MLQLYSCTAVKVFSAELAVIRVHVLPLVPVTRTVTRSQANVCRTTYDDNIYKPQLTSSSVGLAQARPNYQQLHNWREGTKRWRFVVMQAQIGSGMVWNIATCLPLKSVRKC